MKKYVSVLILSLVIIGSTVNSAKAYAVPKIDFGYEANQTLGSNSEMSVEYAGIYTTKNVYTYLNIREYGDISSAVIGQIPAGAEFTVSHGDGAWAHIEYNGVTGFSSMEYMQKISEIPSEITIENAAYPEWFVKEGNSYLFAGVIRSKLPVIRTWGGVYYRNSDNALQSIEVSPDSYNYDISDILTENIKTEVLDKGEYTFCLYAQDSNGNSFELINSDFTVGNEVFTGIMGDMNFDGSLTIADAIIMQQYLLNSTDITEKQYIAADMNKDTYVNVFDMALMRKGIITITDKTEPNVMLDVPEYCQHPDYPTGCESAALYMLLQYYGTDVTMEQIVSELPKGPLPYYKNGTLYGANPEKEFVGDPHSSYSYGVFNEPLAKTAEKFRNGVITKTSVPLSEVISLLDKGSPSVVWYTTNPEKGISYIDSWYDYQTGDIINWPAGEHAVVVCGHDSENITYRDPNTGSSRTMSQEDFKVIYNELGGRILYYEY